MKTIGGRNDISLAWGNSFAFYGIKGAPIGSATEI